jgi:hypothetical protein
MAHYIIPEVHLADIMREEKILKQDKGLTILVEAVEYCKRNDVHFIRYSELRKLSYDSLNDLTNGIESSFAGGSFEFHIKKYVNEGYLKRDKKSPNKSFIIPNIAKIRKLLNKKKLKTSFDEMNVESLSLEGSADTKHSGKLGIQIEGGLINFGSLMEELACSDESDLQKSVSFKSYPWMIYTGCPKDKSFQLSEYKIQQLLRIGQSIALEDTSMPFKIVLEYAGSKPFIKVSRNVHRFITSPP